MKRNQNLKTEKKNPSRHFSKVIAILLILLTFSIISFGKTLHRKSRVNRRPAQLNSIPFKKGESLSHSIGWGPLNAGKLTLQVADINSEFFSLEAHALSSKTVSIACKINDTITSQWDMNTFSPNRFSVEGRECNQQKKRVETYSLENHIAHFSQVVDDLEKKKPKQTEEKNLGFPAGAQDPLSFIFYLRLLKLPKIPGRSVEIPVINEGKTWTVRLTYLDTDQLMIGKNKESTKADVYSLSCYELGGQDKNEKTKIWISSDFNQLILKISTKIAVGSIVAKLDELPHSNP